MTDTEYAMLRMELSAMQSIHMGNIQHHSNCTFFLLSIGMEATQENQKRVSDAVQSAVRSELEAFAKENKIKQEAV